MGLPECLLSPQQQGGDGTASLLDTGTQQDEQQDQLDECEGECCFVGHGSELERHEEHCTAGGSQGTRKPKAKRIKLDAALVVPTRVEEKEEPAVVEGKEAGSELPFPHLPVLEEEAEEDAAPVAGDCCLFCSDQPGDQAAMDAHLEAEHAEEMEAQRAALLDVDDAVQKKQRRQTRRQPSREPHNGPKMKPASPPGPSLLTTPNAVVAKQAAVSKPKARRKTPAAVSKPKPHTGAKKLVLKPAAKNLAPKAPTPKTEAPKAPKSAFDFESQLSEEQEAVKVTMKPSPKKKRTTFSDLLMLSGAR